MLISKKRHLNKYLHCVNYSKLVLISIDVVVIFRLWSTKNLAGEFRIILQQWIPLKGLRRGEHDLGKSSSPTLSYWLWMLVYLMLTTVPYLHWRISMEMGQQGRVWYATGINLLVKLLSRESLENESECGCHARLEGTSQMFWITLKAYLKLNINIFLECWCYVEFCFSLLFECLVYTAWSKY